MTLTTLTSTADVIEVTRNLRSPGRDRVAVLVTCQRGTDLPLFDPAEIDTSCGGNVDVYVLPSNKLSYTFNENLPEGTSVFGGAARVYPRGDLWVDDLWSAPVTFAYSRAEAALRLDTVIDAAWVAHFTPAPAPRDHAAAVSARDDAPVPAAVEPPRPFGVSPATAPIRLSPRPASTARMLSPAPTVPAPRQALVAAALTAIAPSKPAGLPTAPPAPAENRSALNNALRTITMLQGQLRAAELTGSQDLLLAAQENAHLRRRSADQVEGHREKLRVARKRKVEQSVSSSVWEPDLFAAADDAVRHAVYLTWARRVPAADKATRTLPVFAVGSAFADSIDSLDDGQRAKAFKCVVDVLTDLVRDMPARRVHPLREGTGTGEAQVARVDGALCFRANIETATASARRLHYFKLVDGSIELSRVVLHDDMLP